MTSGVYMPNFEFTGWEPCPWDSGALLGYCEGLEIEVATVWTPSHGYYWTVRGYFPYAKLPDIIESGYSRGVAIAQQRAFNAARRLATPSHVRERHKKEIKAAQERRRTEAKRKRRLEKVAREQAEPLDETPQQEDI